MNQRGRFITLEGGEGAGKSTQQRRLAAWLRDGGRDVVETREPGGSPGAEEIRALLVTGAAGRWDAVTEALLHFAARRDHLVQTVEPALDRGAWVVCDRFADSTMAYQGYGYELGREKVAALYDLVVGDTHPDLTLVLDLPVAEGLARARSRKGAPGEDRYERMDIAFHERLRVGFHDIVVREPGRCVLIDASGDEAAVAAGIRAAVTERLGAAAA
ncbi:MAG: dTMP kinase [Kiloniellaceae bacterium]